MHYYYRATSLLVRPRVRSFHASFSARHLVGPNDPVSNLRPIVYTDIPTPLPSHARHPYSLGEFTDSDVPQDHTLELQYKLARESLDAFNHYYWADSNTRFEAAKQSVLASLPESATPEVHENALSEFYKKWVMQEKTRQDEYSNEWRKRNWENIMLAARVEYQRFKQRFQWRIQQGGPT